VLQYRKVFTFRELNKAKKTRGKRRAPAAEPALRLRGYKTLGAVEQDRRALGEVVLLVLGSWDTTSAHSKGRRLPGRLALAMATRPGPLTEWPWQRLGNFKVRTYGMRAFSPSIFFLG